MSRLLFPSLCALFILGAGPASAQSSGPQNEASQLSADTIGGLWHFQWWGATGKTYFLQHSTDLLLPWHYLPVIEKGADASVLYRLWIDPQSPRFFLRLRHITQSPADAYSADFDADGLPNGWELERGLDPFYAPDAANTSGGLTNLQAYQQSLGGGGDPTVANLLGLVVYTPAQ
jgi:hypothetical protein